MKKLKDLVNSYNYKYSVLYLMIFILIGISLYVLSYFNYLLFHTTAELFSIIIAAAIFILAWNTKDYSENNDLLFLGIIYLFVGIIDLFHTLTYKGLNLFGSHVFFATEFWIAARYMESVSLLIFTIFLNRVKRKSCIVIALIYIAVTTVLVMSILVWKIFPVAYIDIQGQGLTEFKIVSEYIIMSILAFSIIILILKRNHINRKLLYYFILFIGITIISEFFFTLYTDVYGIWNFFGHYLKIISFYLVYKAIIEYSLKNPYEIIFNELKQHEKQLEEANATKDKFFSIISHDLKGVFSGILGFSKYLNQKYAKLINKDRIHFIQLIQSSSEQAYNLLENLLHWAEMQTGKLKVNKEKINIKIIIEEVSELYTHNAQKKQISMEAKISDDLNVRADRFMIFTVISNLVSNALKFTHAGGEVAITGYMKNRNIQISVSDTGVGIKTKDMEKLFKLDSDYKKKGTEKESGTGLGLILCKEFIDMHHGRIWVESDFGKGTTFNFSIPV
ncbi:MAG: hypothetical protein JW822_05915 [Spirochaetales bacterium]|nr:hypothetical protein [Spirochaetales bacterium]